MMIAGRFVAVATIASFMAFASSAHAASAPRVSVDSIDALLCPDHPYDEKVDAIRIVDAALARGARDHKLVLIDLGGNWCADCRILSGVMELPEMRKFLDAHYEVVSVDVGRFNKNLEIPARYGITERMEGVPAVLVVTPDGTLVDRGHLYALDDARAMTPQGIADWLASWAR